MSCEEDWSMAGDLGLGLGLKPGSLPKNGELPFRTLLCRRRSSDSNRRRSSSSSSGCPMSGERRRVFLERRKSLVVAAAELSDHCPLSRSNSSAVWDSSDNTSKLSTLLRKLKWKCSENSNLIEEKVGLSCERNTDTELAQAQETIAVLQGKLEVYQELLYGKYKASEVLLNKLSESIQEHDEWQQKWKRETSDSQREINDLQYKLLCSEGNLTDAQRAWLDRFNSLVKENGELQNTVHQQAKILRKLSIDKSDLKREREELLAMQDAKERIAYQRSNSFGSTNNEEMGPIELGILGACKCRTETLDPCVCAKAACNKHKLLVDTQSALAELEEEQNELKRHCQLYREAFEEQLKRNKILTKRILLREHSETDLFLKTRRLSSLLRLRGKQSNKTEAVDSLVDMVCDRTDALLQQELLTKILAQRVQELEK